MDTSPQMDDADEPAQAAESLSPQRNQFFVSLGQSAEQYMSHLPSQKRYHIGDDDSDDRDDSDNDDDAREGGVCAGYIRKLTLRNFMNHDHFELELGPQMNFIVGRNGSGKSAVLTGLLVGLGAKAMDTNRGLSVRSLIKDGRSTASVVVELGNEGLDAYEPETYGAVILVERKFTRDGTNTYTLRSEHGAVVMHKKRVLDDILQKFNIVVNNPLAFLSQDKAREFIASSTERSRFAYFSEGTNIQSIIQNYQDASRHILHLQQRQADAKQHYDEACQKYAECERGYRKFKHSHTLRQQLEKINGKIYWFNVDVVGRKIQWAEGEIVDLEREQAQVRAEIARHKKQLTDTDAELQTAADGDQARQREIAEAVQHRKDAGDAFDAAARDVLGVRAELMNYKSEIQDLQTQLEKHQAALADEQRKLDEANGGTREAMGERLKVLKQRLDQLVMQRDKVQSQLLALEQPSAELDALKSECEDARRARVALQQQYAGLEKAQHDSYAAFGVNVRHLVRDIKRDTRWHKQPVGPLGYYVSVTSEYSQYNDLINAALQNTLDAFVVCDEHDRRLLAQHMRDKKLAKRVIVRQFERFQYKRNKTLFVTVLDALDIQHEDVKYTLIDASSVEEAALCASLAEAEQAAGQPGVARAFCLNDRRSGTRIMRGDDFITRDPVFYPRDLPKLAGKVSLGSLREELQEAANAETQAKRRRAAQMEKEHAMRNALHAELAQRKAHIKEINSQIFTAERMLEEGDSGRIESLQAQIEHTRLQVHAKEGMSVDLLGVYGDKKRALETCKDAFQAAKQREEELVSVAAAHADRQLQLLRERMELSGEMERLEARAAAANQKHAEHAKAKTADERKQEELRSLAQQRCDRADVTIRDTDTTESITEEFRAVQRAIDEAERSSSKTFEQIQREVLASKAAKDRCEEILVELNAARTTLENELNFRFENLNITVKEKLTRSRLAFEQSLALRGFKGRLEFDFANKRVVTEVQTKDDKHARAVLSLLGGEKSFTQIAFLLSIWKVMRPRVCGLDEFDVFMDSVNRTIAIRLLIHEMRRSSAQSIFITPQDIAVVGDLGDSADIKIHVIKPPRAD